VENVRINCLPGVAMKFAGGLKKDVVAHLELDSV
jgi:hypothetical protein